MNKASETVFKKNKLEDDAINLFLKIEKVLLKTIDDIEVSMWGGYPIYLLGEKSIIIAPFKDHLNIVSNPHRNEKTIHYKNAILIHVDEVKKYYKITPKGMLQIFLHDNIEETILKKIYIDIFNQ